MFDSVFAESISPSCNAMFPPSLKIAAAQDVKDVTYKLNCVSEAFKDRTLLLLLSVHDCLYL